MQYLDQLLRIVKETEMYTCLVQMYLVRYQKKNMVNDGVLIQSLFRPEETKHIPNLKKKIKYHTDIWH
jgi:uncharacterized protein with HEPN domain